ncbi:hypothetical protein A5893_16555 [Pedobacter psychrophilus]|uniref:DUF4197 domain-containing protein n=1 Tax=Pedobacter psychrophilus TaxID=1826909 RepID=A0A179DAF8_9SPHI|nr:DUF4197 domain-containing protein [Pedobacter psychrophilus]OAQ37978.1 hypothetical protein A5893_16555 [Pedobacter psychrophilus]
MKKLILISILSTTLLFSSCDTLNQYAGVINQATGIPTNTEINLGLKQALEFGTNYSAERLSAKDGYLGNLAVKILMPPEAQKVEKTLRSLGLNSLCDNVITSLNRAAEDAAIQAKPIFVNAIKQMSFQDVSNILLGQQDAATMYFKRTTSIALADKFRPSINTSLSKVGATKYWGDLTSTYNKIPLVKPINTDLAGYVTDRAIDGLFIEVAQEELKIRQNLVARSTSLLQKVFGYADRNRQ